MVGLVVLACILDAIQGAKDRRHIPTVALPARRAIPVVSAPKVRLIAASIVLSVSHSNPATARLGQWRDQRPTG